MLPSAQTLSVPATRVINSFNDPRNEFRMFQFSWVVADLTYVTDTATSLGEEVAFLACLDRLDESPRDSLYRALMLQLLRSYQAPPYPRRCVGCGKWFRETEDETTAIDGRGWKRGDSRYHSARCRKAALERGRRARLREEKRGAKPRNE